MSYNNVTNLRAISENTFLVRGETESSIGDIEISEGAQVGSMEATVASSDGIVDAGDVVHVPHYGVQDAVINGVEYAICKSDRLFAKRVDGVYSPINRYVKIRKCENDHIRDESGEIALYMTKNHIENTNWAEIVEVADDCDKMSNEHIGMFCVAPESDERLARIGRTSDYCLHEDLIIFVTTGE